MSNWIAASGNPFGKGLDAENSAFGNSVYYANGKWVAVGKARDRVDTLGKNIWYSIDGKAWTAATATASGPIFGNTGVGKSVYYGNGKWVAVGDGSSGSANIWHSDDGISWTAASNQPFGTEGYGNSVYYANGYWVAVGKDNSGEGNNIWYSSDGISWSASAGSPFGNNRRSYGNSVYYGNGKWVAVGQDDSGEGNNIWHSSDGISWTAATGNPFANGYGNSVYYNGTDKWVAVGQDGSGEGNNIWHSGDGISWTVATASESGPIFGDSGEGYSVYYANNKWVAVGDGSSGSANIWHSSDGISWTASTGSPFGTAGPGRSVYYANGQWVSVGRNFLEKIWYSTTNGLSWSAATGEPFRGGLGLSVYYGNGQWVAVGYTEEIGSTIWYDGITPPTPTPTPQVIVDLEIFRLPPCKSVVVVDSLEGRLLTASIAPFNKDLFYAFYVDGVKVLDNIRTSEFQYTFPFPGVRMIYITCSSKSTINAYQETIPKTIVTVVVV